MIIISDALPIQWFRNGEPTFNESVEAGIDMLPFYQKWNGDDEIKLQFFDDEAVDEATVTFDIQVFDCYGELLQTIPMAENNNGLFELTFIPQDYVDQYIFLKLRKAISGGSYTIEARTDLLDIQESHQDTRLISYSNELDFADLVYSDLNPVPSFNIRVHSKFYRQRGPEQNESDSLSNGSTVKLMGSVKKQKLLQVEPAPYYFHHKMKLILQHNTIYIANKPWLKEESYETTELDSKYPFDKAECWLTETEKSFSTNVFGGIGSEGNLHEAVMDEPMSASESSYYPGVYNRTITEAASANTEQNAPTTASIIEAATAGHSNDGSVFSITYSISVYAKHSFPPPNNSTIYYRVNGGSWTYLAEISNTTCLLVGFISGLSVNDDVDLLVENSGAAGRYFNAQNSDICPTPTPIYIADRAGVNVEYYPIFNISSDLDVSLSIDTTGEIE